MTEAQELLASLLERVEKQLTYEYYHLGRQEEELENMTVKRFLEMLAYIQWDNRP